MRTKVFLGSAGLQLCSLLLALAPAARSAAATLEISVRDEQGKPIEDVAVYVTPASGNVGPDGAVLVTGSLYLLQDLSIQPRAYHGESR